MHMQELKKYAFILVDDH